MTTPQLIRAALAEDIGRGDCTSRLTIPSRRHASARMVARARGVLAGLDICRQVFQTVDPKVRFTPKLKDGDCFRPGMTLAGVEGRARSLLAGERVALNFVQRLSGIATLTRRFVEAVGGARAVILDTRKTTPGWRALEKYAVRCGGAGNHRAGLYDMVLIKDNHIAACGSITRALQSCRLSRLEVEVEVRTLADVQEALAAGAKRLLLDNMSVAQLRRAVARARGRARLEASGRVTLRNVRQVAATGVDYVSVGAITHSAPAADIALDFCSD
ncbi:carboxylating nicotinate-nucleotide diphosphorylase [candidate division WOR-3 bacterium]|nr:carboxylating nicotinate-nucleotide diphosphorylase [candidate division WOR-3 bacterium]